MAWIEIHQHLKEHRKTRKFKNLMNITRAQAIGHLVMLWLWGIDNTDDYGLILDADYDDIAIACDYHADSQLIVSALITAGFLEKDEKGGNLYIHDFEDYIGRLKELKKRHRDAQKRYSEKAKAIMNDGQADSHADDQPDGLDDARKIANLTVPYLTVPNLDTNNINNVQKVEIDSETHGKRPVGTKEIGTLSVAWAEKNWGRMLSPGEVGEINSWCDEFKTRGCLDTDAVVTEALKQCDYASVRNMKYLRAVLVDWRDTGVLTVAHVEAREAERKSQKDRKGDRDPGDKKPGKTPSNKYDNFYL